MDAVGRQLPLQDPTRQKLPEKPCEEVDGAILTDTIHQNEQHPGNLLKLQIQDALHPPWKQSES